MAGLLSAAQVVPKIHRAELYGLATMLTQTLMHWTHRVGGINIEWPFIVACFDGDRDGIPLPEEWRESGTPECNATRVEGGSWTHWTGFAAYAVPHLLTVFPPAAGALGDQLRDAKKVIYGLRMAEAGEDVSDSTAYLVARFTAIPEEWPASWL